MLDLFSRPDVVPADKDKPIGLDHLCLQLEMPPINEVIEVLQQAQGRDILGIHGPAGQHISVYIYDPGGIHIELRLDTSA